MKTYRRTNKILSISFIICVLTAAMPASMALALDMDTETGSLSTDAETGTAIYLNSESMTIYDDGELPDSEELFEEYARREFQESIYGEIERLPAMYGTAAADNMQEGGPQKAIYDKLKPEIEKIAAGQLDSSKVTLHFNLTEICCDEESLGVPIAIPGTGSTYVLNPVAEEAFHEKLSGWVRQAYRALLEDCPYDFYWWDKTGGLMYAYKKVGFYLGNKPVIALKELYIDFIVAQEYRGSSEFTLDTAKTSATTTAIANAKAVVDNNASKGDLEKLDAYRQYICDAVSYNRAAAGAVPTVYGNPWQLIWVFDDNPDTNVVCEGYSKAFQYLCDLSQFQNEVTCYSLWGKAGILGGSPEGHMWNAVNYRGENYLVDLTNCDAGSLGMPDKLYMAPAIYVPLETGETEGTEGTEVTYNKTEEPSFYALIDLENETIMSYTYDEDQKDFIVSGYLPMSDYPIFSLPEGLTATYGDTLSAVSLPEVSGLGTPGTWQWIDPEQSVGDASPKAEFSARFVPSGQNLFAVAEDVKIPVRVEPKFITDLTVENISPQEYKGVKVMPEVAVTGDGGKTLEKNRDYIVEYGDNNRSGTNAGTVTVKAKEGGNYTFSDVTVQFDIKAAAGGIQTPSGGGGGGGGGGGTYLPPSSDEGKQSELKETGEAADETGTEEEAEIEAVKNFNPKAKSKVVRLKNGKKAVLLTWDKGNVELDGVEIYRSTKRNSGYGKKPIFTTKKDTYCNSAVKTGKTYYYKLRGFVVVEGVKYYTGFSNKAYRTVK